jgi:hypothetical protein
MYWHMPNEPPKTRDLLTQELNPILNKDGVRKYITEPKGIKPAFDPFCVYYAFRQADLAAKVYERYVHLDTPLPRFTESCDENTTCAKVSVVAHINAGDAESDGMRYADYVAAALFAKTPKYERTFAHATLFQDWTDWDNLLAARCLLYSFGDGFTLYSVGRPVKPSNWPTDAAGDKIGFTFKPFDPAKHGDLIKKGAPMPVWPPYNKEVQGDGVDTERSKDEAARVAATWRTVLCDWGAPKAARAVVDCGFTARHGMNPDTHSELIDLVEEPHPACESPGCTIL